MERLKELSYGMAQLKLEVEFFKLVFRNPSKSPTILTVFVPVWFLITFSLFFNLKKLLF